MQPNFSPNLRKDLHIETAVPGYPTAKPNFNLLSLSTYSTIEETFTALELRLKKYQNSFV